MSEEEDIHPIFLKDPEELMQYVYKKVCIVTDDGVEHVGLVYTVDPVSETYALVTLGETTKLELILGHAVRSVTILSENIDMYKDQLDNLFRSKEQGLRIACLLEVSESPQEDTGNNFSYLVSFEHSQNLPAAEGYSLPRGKVSPHLNPHLSLSEEDLQKKQFQLKCWLLKNRLPIEVGGAKGELLTLADALVIHPPYGADNCYSTNEIILGKIQGLIKNMPADQEDW